MCIVSAHAHNRYYYADFQVMEQAYLYRMASTLHMDRVPLMEDPDAELREKLMLRLENEQHYDLASKLAFIEHDLLKLMDGATTARVRELIARWEAGEH